ncbi:hypothetical protein BG011_000838 [Mortierella polycephala]|uniref:RRM domain-containing protein n=1 Tax=Mortierella polycephala TaxID=41804 RepID=A0A9P6PLY0_9FUNG|nr:hypothetical protein BG011_000838 [Mortierella polycephala]
MGDKLQEKFALLQQMKREKELKEAKAKELQPFDIFSIAGVNLPNVGSGGLNMTIRHNGQSAAAAGPTIGSVKRPRKNRTLSSSSDLGEGSGRQGPLSSTAAPDLAPQADLRESDISPTDLTFESGHSRKPSEISVVADSIGGDKTDSLSTATPPTPIPSPKNDISSRRNSGSLSPTKLLVKDMTHNVQSRSGSVDENEEMVIDMFGRSVPRSRHHSSDEGSDSENESARQYYRRSRSRSVSPYYSRDNAGRRRGRGRRGGREGRDRYSGDEMPSAPAEDIDPYQAASRYLDTAFYPTKIYVGNLPSSISLTSLRTLFAPFGDIEDMNLVEGKDFGFVTYVEPASAQQALAKMNGSMLDGICIRVNRAKIPERNRRGFAGVAWMDEDGELARVEEQQHQQAAAIAGSFLATGPSNASSSSSNGHRSSGGGMATSDTYAESLASSPCAVSPTATPARSTHQLPAKPRSPKLPPKPTGAAAFPPAGLDPRAVMTGRGGGRQILRYDDL